MIDRVDQRSRKNCDYSTTRRSVPAYSIWWSCGGCWSLSHISRTPYHKDTACAPAPTIMPSIINLPTPLLLSAVFGSGVSIWLLVRRSGRLPFPPGPAPDPVIGNLRQMGSGNVEFVFEEWGKEYGEWSWLCKGGNPLSELLRTLSQGPSIMRQCLDSTS